MKKIKNKKYKRERADYGKLKSTFLNVTSGDYSLSSVPASRLPPDKSVSGKCGDSCASFLLCLRDPHLNSPVPHSSAP